VTGDDPRQPKEEEPDQEHDEKPERKDSQRRRPPSGRPPGDAGQRDHDGDHLDGVAKQAVTHHAHGEQSENDDGEADGDGAGSLGHGKTSVFGEMIFWRTLRAIAVFGF
jgi:hypothetical protein